MGCQSEALEDDHQYKAGQILNIEVADHLIISEDAHLSFESEGLMNKIRHSDSYKILSKEEQLLQQFKVDAERTKAIEEEKVRTAKKMKKDGVDVEIIKKYRGYELGRLESCRP